MSKRLSVGGAVLVSILAGCGGDPNATSGSAPVNPSSPPAARHSSSPGARPGPSASDGDDLRRCRDADCEVEVASGQKLSFDNAVDVPITVKISDGRVDFDSEDPESGSRSHIQTTPGGTVTINGITMRILALQGDSAIIRVSRGR